MNDAQVRVGDRGGSLLEALREDLHILSVKDGCSPQGQCGCCTVLVDGQPRVACVTPVSRVRGRVVTTLEGMPPEETRLWSEALCSTGGSQCGFCTPGIIVRLAGLAAKKPDAARLDIDRALAAHLCRCTGWNTIVEACDVVARVRDGRMSGPSVERDFAAASTRATIEGGTAQQVNPSVALGQAGFASDTVPPDALVAVRGEQGDWVVAESMAEARLAAGKVQGRRTTLEATAPLEVPEGDWAVTLRTKWVEPGYLETDVSWCEPGGEPASVLANGGAFGAKQQSLAMVEAKRLADDLGRPVRVVLSREDAVRFGPKRPPVAGGARADGTGILHIVRTPGIAEAIASVAPSLTVVEHDVAGPPTSVAIRGAGWVEALALVRAATADTGAVHAPGGATAEASLTDGRIQVRVDAGMPLDHVVLRSYVIGAAHMAYSWVRSEAITVDGEGEIHDLTIRSFGILKASEMPPVDVEIVDSEREPVNGSDAVFAAVASATWAASGLTPVWPVTGAQN